MDVVSDMLSYAPATYVGIALIVVAALWGIGRLVIMLDKRHSSAPTTELLSSYYTQVRDAAADLEEAAAKYRVAQAELLALQARLSTLEADVARITARERASMRREQQTLTRLQQRLEELAPLCPHGEMDCAVQSGMHQTIMALHDETACALEDLSLDPDTAEVH